VKNPTRQPGGPVELRWQIWLPWLALMVLLLTATRTDPDLWGHVRFGLDFLASHELPSVDPYSFTQGRPWVNHEWASEAAMGLAYRLGGGAGLVLMKAVVMSGVVWVLIARFRGSPPLLAAMVSAVALAGALPLSVTVRPQLWSALGLMLLVLVLDDRRPAPGRVAFTAALFAAWANLHGGWVTGGAALALHIALRTLRSPDDAPRWLLLGFCGLAATLLNPYGVELWRFLAATVAAARPDISEWQPFSLREPAIMWVSVLAPGLVLVALHLRRRWRPPLEAAAVVLLLVLAGFKVSRVAPLVCAPALALLAPSISRAWGDRLRLRVPDRTVAAVMLAPAALSLLAVPRPVAAALACVPIHDSWAPDLAAAPALQGARGRVWTAFVWGEYTLWHFGPGLKVSIDGRRETVYDEAYIALHRRAEEADEEAVAHMIGLHPDYVWLPPGDGRIRARLAAAGYEVPLTTAHSFVAARAGAPPLTAVRAPAGACFP
jgi:hypothetical protein